MPTATAFVYPRPFSPVAHCPEDKTTAQLDALNFPRYESSNLGDIMALWWNLYTVDFEIQFGADPSQTRTTEAIRKAAGGSVSDVLATDVATPLLRVCASYEQSAWSGSTLMTALLSPLDDANGDDTWLGISLYRVYYNTTTGKYALLFNMKADGGAGGVTFYGNGNGAASNGGTVTIFGSSTYAGTKQSGYANVTLTISNPVYYTY
jgi:hypothetical protein